MPSAQRHERRAQRDLGLAEADVAADEPVHRLARRHVLYHRLDRGRLVGRLVEAEALREEFVVARLQRERVALPGRALRVEVEQLRGRVVRLLRGLLLRLFPLAAAEFVQRRGFRRRTAVAADEVQVRHRHVELRVVRVDELQELVRTIPQVEREEAEIAADAVRLVDHRIADADLREVAHHRVDIRAPGGLARAAADDVRVEFGLRDERDPAVGPGETRVHGRRDEHDAVGAAEEAREVVGERGQHVELGEELLHRLAPAGGLRHERDLQVGRGDEAFQRGERVGGAAVDLHRRHRRRRARAVGTHLDARESLQHAVERVDRQEQFGGRQQRARLVAAQQPVARFRVGPEVVDRTAHVAVQRDDRRGRQVVRKRGRRLEEQRQVILDAAGRHAVRDVLVQRRLGRIPFEHLAEPAAETGPARLVERELACRQQPDVGHRIDRALRVDVEGLDRLDVVVEEVDAVRQRRAHREEVDETAAHAELAGGYHLRHVRIAGQCQLRAQRIDVEPLALLQEERERGEVRRGCQPVERAGRRDDEDIALVACDPIQRGEPLRHQVLVRRELVVGERLPIGEECNAQVRRVPGNLRREPLRRERVGADDREHPVLDARAGGEFGQGQRVGRTGERPRAEPAAGVGQVRNQRWQEGSASAGCRRRGGRGRVLVQGAIIPGRSGAAGGRGRTLILPP